MSDEENPGKFGLILAFDTDEPEFARGFEAGALYSTLAATSEEIIRNRHIHRSNEVMVRRIADLYGFEVLIDDAGDGCSAFATFYRKHPVAAA